MINKWDVFISHASEDKDSIVREIAFRLEQLGVRVWYDEFSLRLGDSLSRSIDQGLLDSDFGLVIISQNFLNKRWTDYEYRSLLAKEDGGKKVLLPIWYGVSKNDIGRFSLYLADKLALDASALSIDKVLLKVLEIIRPDIYQSIKAYNLFKEKMKTAKTIEVDFDRIIPREERRSKLTQQQEVRAKNIFYGIGRVLGSTIEDHVYRYELDTLPEREIQVWEIMNLCFLEFTDKYNIGDSNIRIEVATLLLGFSLGQLFNVRNVNDEGKVELYNLWTEYVYEF